MALLYDERYGAADIAKRISDIGRRVSFDYKSGAIVLIAVLKGAGFFVADLARAITRAVRCEYIDVIKKGEDEVTNLNFITSFDVKDANVIVLKDVTRSGVTETYLVNQLLELAPRSIRFAALVDRPQERKCPLLVDYVLFPSEEGILVGYGMEYQGEGGNLPFIAQVRTEGEAPFDASDPGSRKG
ncbi:MAG: phosphoribosyltransferase [Thermoanaerobaculia bacterium]